MWVKAIYGVRTLGWGILAMILGFVGGYFYMASRLVQMQIEKVRGGVLPISEEMVGDGVEVKAVRD